MTNYPQCDEKLRQIGDEVWGGAKRKGRVFSGITVKDTLAAMRLTPDFSAQGASVNADLRFIHRRDGENEIYFIANRQARPEDFTASFRVSGKKAEIVDPVTGRIFSAGSVRHGGERTSLPLHLEANGSVFVIFRPRSSAPQMPIYKEAMSLKGPWTVAFTPGWSAPESTTFLELQDWSKRPESGIKYYSGTAIYKKTLTGMCMRPGQCSLISAQ